MGLGAVTPPPDAAGANVWHLGAKGGGFKQAFRPGRYSKYLEDLMANPNPNVATRFSEGNKLGQVWRPGQSGNPRGISHLQREWRLAYANALIAIGAKETGTVEEAAAVVARIVWGAALRHEAWAVHELVEAVGGPRALRLEIERVPDDEKFDPTRLSDKQLEELTRLLELAGGQLPAIESGEKPAAPSDVH